MAQANIPCTSKSKYILLSPTDDRPATPSGKDVNQSEETVVEQHYPEAPPDSVNEQQLGIILGAVILLLVLVIIVVFILIHLASSAHHPLSASYLVLFLF